MDAGPVVDIKHHIWLLTTADSVCSRPADRDDSILRYDGGVEKLVPPSTPSILILHTRPSEAKPALRSRGLIPAPAAQSLLLQDLPAPFEAELRCTFATLAGGRLKFSIRLAGGHAGHR